MIWQTAHKNLEIKQGDIHVWRVHLPSQMNQLQEYYNSLSQKERNRAERFKFLEHRQRFIIAKGVLRNILAYYLSLSPQEIKLSYGQHGKPGLINREVKEPVSLFEFNQSDSQDYAVYAFTLKYPIGIDIEYMERPAISIEDIARRFFSSTEYDGLMHFPKENRKVAFYRLWTCKEAFLKAIGKGLSFPLHNFDININLSYPQLLRISDTSFAKESWQIREIKVADDYACALVVKDLINTIYLYHFTDLNTSLTSQ